MDIPKAFQKKLLPIALMLLATTTLFTQKIIRYDLIVKDTIVNYAGKEKRAIAVNGQIPMPTLTFTEGDTAEIVVHNQLKENTSLHWHGIFLPNKEDGVWVTTICTVTKQKPIWEDTSERCNGSCPSSGSIGDIEKWALTNMRKISLAKKMKKTTEPR